MKTHIRLTTWWRRRLYRMAALLGAFVAMAGIYCSCVGDCCSLGPDFSDYPIYLSVRDERGADLLDTTNLGGLNKKNQSIRTFYLKSYPDHKNFCKYLADNVETFKAPEGYRLRIYPPLPGVDEVITPPDITFYIEWSDISDVDTIACKVDWRTYGGADRPATQQAWFNGKAFDEELLFEVTKPSALTK